MKNNTCKNEIKLNKAIRLPQVCDLTGASRATIWRWMKSDPTFPRCFHLSAGVSVWDLHEVVTWLDGKKAQRLMR